jgi:hypothetical protein
MLIRKVEQMLNSSKPYKHLLSELNVLVSFSLLWQNSWEKHLRKGRIYFGHSFRGFIQSVVSWLYYNGPVVRQNSGDVGGRLLTKWQSGRTEREREREREERGRQRTQYTL